MIHCVYDSEKASHLASKKNTITEHVQRVHHELAMIKLMASSFEGTTRSALSERKEKGLTSLSMTQLLGKYTTQEGRVTASYGGYRAHGDNWVALIDEAIRLVQLDAVGNAFEIIENFIKAVASELLYSERGRIPIDQKVRQQVLQDRRLRENTPQYFSRVAKTLARHSGNELFKILFKYVPGLEESVSSAGKYDLRKIHRIVECFRHCKAHKNGRCGEEDYEHLPQAYRRIVKWCLKQSAVFGDQRILPEHTQIASLLTWECEFTQIIYEAISLKLGMEIDYKPLIEPPRKPKRQQ